MSDYACPECSTPVPEQAMYCPRCGSDLLEFKPATPASAESAKSKRESIVGWTLWISGGLLAVLGLFTLSGVRSWVALGLGIAMFVVGLGTLVGDDTKRQSKGKNRRRAKNETTV
ncbi:zinc ribbon domain-containing protein [Humisphaera borealis]|uniref:Zinc ribbon domain-containing protein n=1 Tax=Humisphaera borealis TaxID=2807512 RepID=A0A7M2WTK7_9BACT|nr:zinc ribbon domain-containing protein [Humisphaera borealis]QOV88769.1 zinc ribbon domain-containing protein [Humisphaera borealis]